MTRGIVTPSPKSNMQVGTFVEFLHRHRSLEFACMQYYLGFSFLREFAITKPPCGIVRRASQGPVTTLGEYTEPGIQGSAFHFYSGKTVFDAFRIFIRHQTYG